MSVPVLLSIEDIFFTEKRRRGICPRRVEELRREVESGRDMTPIKVRDLGNGKYTVEDGRHRIKAHLAAGISTIYARIKVLLGRMWTSFFRWL